MEELIAFLGIVTIGLLAILYGILVRSLLIYKFYYWFFLLVFPGADGITFIQSVALSFVFTVVNTPNIGTKYAMNGKELEEKPKWAEIIMIPWVMLLVGWIAHLIIK